MIYTISMFPSLFYSISQYKWATWKSILLLAITGSRLMQSFLLSVGEKFVPILKESNFRETGRLTPEEVINFIYKNYYSLRFFKFSL